MLARTLIEISPFGHFFDAPWSHRPNRNHVELITTTRVPASTCSKPAAPTGVERKSLNEALPLHISSSVGGGVALTSLPLALLMALP